MNAHICSGCKSFSYYLMDCSAGINIKDNRDCPCMSCLIKVMCNEACEGFEEKRGDWNES